MSLRFYESSGEEILEAFWLLLLVAGKMLQNWLCCVLSNEWPKPLGEFTMNMVGLSGVA